MQILAALVGMNFRPREAREIVKTLSIGDELELEPEPSNPWDSNAVKVIEPNSGEFIGYLSRESNAETAEHLTADGEYECKVVAWLATNKPHLEITLFEDDREAGLTEDLPTSVIDAMRDLEIEDDE